VIEKNFEKLKRIIYGVEEENQLRRSRWSDWDHWEDILMTYSEKSPEFIDTQNAVGDIPKYEAERILRDAITTDGESLEWDLPNAEREVLGEVVKGSFCDREKKPSAKCKEHNLRSLRELSLWCGKSVQTIINWKKHNPMMFNIAVKGVSAIKDGYRPKRRAVKKTRRG
jgi:hypothetical protein